MTYQTQRVRTAIKALMGGYPITIDGTIYRMSEEFDIVVEMDQYTIDDGKQVYKGKQHLGTDMTVSRFIQICGHMTEQEYIGVVAQLVLNDE